MGVRCDNHMDRMYEGGLVSKGPRCGSLATVVMDYVETVDDAGVPLTREVRRLCDECANYVRRTVRTSRLERKKRRGALEGISWVRRLVVVPLSKASPEQLSVLSANR